jgi:opacity protein-like surface antigen
MCGIRSTAAQARGALFPEPGRFEVSAGPLWMGGDGYGSRDATLTSPNGDRYRLFSTSNDLGAATGLEARFGARVTRIVSAEIVGSYAAPALHTSISGDVEGASSLIASEPIKQFTVEAAAIVLIPKWRFGSRALPFVDAGGGYLRHLHDERALVETGQIYHVGGGVKFVFATRGRNRGTQVGIRADARASIRTRAATLDGRAHTAPALGVSLFARF